MRSSIACTRCRRSKVKCVNNGVGTICRDCENKGRECTYPPSAPNGAPIIAKREGSVPRSFHETHVAGETPRRPRSKKQHGASVSTKDSMRAMVDALDPNLLEPKVWFEVFDLFQQHYGLDIPFIHPPTFLKPLRDIKPGMNRPNDFNASIETIPNPMPEAAPMVLLGMLALTAKYCPRLVAHHSPPSATRASNPLIASEYYAAALRARLVGKSGDGLGTSDLPRICALIMLGQHEWAVGQGVRAFVTLGVAWRYCQVSGLLLQEDLDEQITSYTMSTLTLSEQRNMEANRKSLTVSSGEQASEFIEAEVRRRIVWAVMTLDRYLASGKHRVQAVHLSDLHIQLPSSERCFSFGKPVYTAILSDEGLQIPPDPATRRPDLKHLKREQDLSNAEYEFDEHECILSRYIRAMDLYGKIMRWSCAGGSRRERLGPTDPRSNWSDLQRRLNKMYDELPREIAFTTANIAIHLSQKTSVAFSQLHILLMLCRLLLGRDYLSFAPLDRSRPQPPPNAPRMGPGISHPSFFELNAKETFRTARDLIDLYVQCKDWQVAVQTPMTGFALYVCALLGIYANHFPFVDTDGYLCEIKHRNDDRGVLAVQKAVENVVDFRCFTKMADGWVKTLLRSHKYYIKAKRQYGQPPQRLSMAPPHPAENRWPEHNGVFESNSRTSQQLEKALADFSKIDDEDIEMVDVLDVENGQGLSSTASNSVTGKSEPIQPSYTQSPESTSAPRQGTWQTVNNGTISLPNPSESDNRGSLLNILCDRPAGDTQFDSHRRQASGQLASPSFKPEVDARAAYPPSPYDAGLMTNRLPPINPGPPASHSAAGTPSPFAHPRPLHGYQSPSTTSMSGTSIPSPRVTHTPETAEAWQRVINLTFGGEDIAAFVEGRVLTMVGVPEGGWLARVWGLKTVS